MRLRRGETPFAELVERQLALFAEDEAELLAEAAEAEEAWVRAGRDLAEESYGDFQLVVDAIADQLLALRETYARTLESDAADDVPGGVRRGAARRFRRYASVVADLEP